ncbi:hypothetical protein BaRGS_00026787 [Batillaria attramentaria]|uniref:Uncharacterized protein n=1 Tax=Batillaria attramentaria TaxID=370345 RepID=A0ABD0K3Z3_9CAEN
MQILSLATTATADLLQLLNIFKEDERVKKFPGQNGYHYCSDLRRIQTRVMHSTRWAPCSDAHCETLAVNRSGPILPTDAGIKPDDQATGS